MDKKGGQARLFCNAKEYAHKLNVTCNPAEFFDAYDNLLSCLRELYQDYKAPLVLKVSNPSNREAMAAGMVSRCLESKRWDTVFDAFNELKSHAFMISQDCYGDIVENILSRTGKVIPDSYDRAADRRIAQKILLTKMTMHDMQRFDKLPYLWEGKLQKYYDASISPLVYMELKGDNAAIAKQAISFMNNHLSKAYMVKSSVPIPRGLSIPLDKISFQPFGDYSCKLVCNPYTIDGGISPFPAKLVIVMGSSLERKSGSGDIVYDSEGRIAKASWGQWSDRTGFHLYYDTLDGHFVLSKVEKMGGSTPPKLIYQDQYWVRLEAQKALQRAREQAEFDFLQKNFPTKCPKTVVGYRRMKTQNTPNFQQLQALAEKLGKRI